MDQVQSNALYGHSKNTGAAEPSSKGPYGHQPIPSGLQRAHEASSSTGAPAGGGTDTCTPANNQQNKTERQSSAQSEEEDGKIDPSTHFAEADQDGTRRAVALQLFDPSQRAQTLQSQPQSINQFWN